MSSSKIDNYEYLTGEEILPSDQSRKQKNKISIENERRKQIVALKVLKPEEHRQNPKSTEIIFQNIKD